MKSTLACLLSGAAVGATKGLVGSVFLPTSIRGSMDQGIRDLKCLTSENFKDEAYMIGDYGMRTLVFAGLASIAPAPVLGLWALNGLYELESFHIQRPILKQYSYLLSLEHVTTGKYNQDADSQ